jgi:hypothetical protein
MFRIFYKIYYLIALKILVEIDLTQYFIYNNNDEIYKINLKNIKN